jgi:hypothetical protein
MSVTVLEKTIDEVSVCSIDNNGNKEWRNEKGVLHRVDGPAVEYAGGTVKWFQSGKHHRVGGPAIVWADSSEQWYIEGLLHCTDGPAVIWADGTIEWWQNGKKLSVAKYRETIVRLAGLLTDDVAGIVKGLPFSELESLLYALNGWGKEYE